ncbi:hypothetical protein DB354_20695 [Opitutus sp. ER46]|nr:hypothetical protein DB354_20695 [Opitutus sp. ER46]
MGVVLLVEVALPVPVVALPAAEAPVEPAEFMLEPLVPVVLELVDAPVSVVDVELEPYWSVLLRVPLLQPAMPSARAAIAAAVNVIFCVFIGWFPKLR